MKLNLRVDLQRYITYLEAENNVSPYTIRNYLNDLRGFFAFLNESNVVNLEMIEQSDLRRYLTQLQKRGIAKSSMARKLSAIRSLYRYLVREGLVTSNPVASTSSPKLTRQLPDFLSVEEMERLINAPDVTTPQGQRDKAILELLYDAGLRVSELVHLKVQQVNLGSLEVRVWGKGSKERVALIGKPAVTALNNYLSNSRVKLQGRKNTDALFLNRYGGVISQRSIQTMVDKYARQADIRLKVHPHMLRHTFATHLLDGGADLRVVQELLGHTSLSSTQIYTHVTQTQMRKIYLAAHPRVKGNIQGGR